MHIADYEVPVAHSMIAMALHLACGWRIRKNPGQRSIFTSRDLESSRTPHRSQASDGRLTHCPTLS